MINKIFKNFSLKAEPTKEGSSENNQLRSVNTSFKADSFEREQKKDTKKSGLWTKVVAFASIIGMSVAFFFTHRSNAKTKIAEKALETTKREATETKNVLEEKIKNITKDSNEKIASLEENINKLKDDILGLKNEKSELRSKLKELQSKSESIPEQKIEHEILPVKEKITNPEEIIEPNISPESYENFLQITSKQDLWKTISNRNGLNKIIGYDDLKENIIHKFIAPLVSGAEVPNMILFYGPMGCGKTTIIKSIAEAADCNYVKLKYSLNTKLEQQKLIEAINKAEQSYKETGKHSILVVEEIDGYLVEADASIRDMIKNLSKEKHFTIFGTTNYPQKINTNIIPETGTESFYLGTATESDILKILEYYMPFIVESEPNYSEMLKILKEKTQTHEYSNSKLVSEIQTLILKRTPNNKKLTNAECLELMKEWHPDISKDAINSYKNI